MMIGTFPMQRTQRSSCCIQLLFLITTLWLIPKSVSSSSSIHNLEEEIAVVEQEAQGRELADSRIIGGSNAGKNLYEWFAMPVLKNGNQWGCGGALVAPEFVLSAAHCNLKTKLNWRIGALCDPYKNGNNCGQYVEMLQTKRVWNHPKYKKKNNNNDFALIQLKGKSTVTPVPMDDGPVNFYTGGEPLWTLGFGTMKFGKDNYPTRLQHVETKYMDQTACENAYPNYLVSMNMMCAKKAGVDACQGDSGGPLYDKENDKLVGVVSWGRNCAKKWPGVYARIANQWEEFIKPTICENHGEPKPAYCGSNPTTTPTSSPTSSPVLPTTAPSSSPVSPTTAPSSSPVSPTTAPSSSPVSPSSCPSGQVSFELKIQTDNFGKETFWQLRKQRSIGSKKYKKYLKNEKYANNSYNVVEECLPAGGLCYRFFIDDKAGDGMCCKYGNGSYELIIDGKLELSGFAKKRETYAWCT